MADRTKQLNVALLRALRDCGNYLVPESIWISQVQIEVVPTPSAGELRERIRELDSRGLLISVRDSLGTEYKWRLSDAGTGALLNL